MKLTYWVVHEMYGNPAYSHRAKTKRECLDFLSCLDRSEVLHYSMPAKIIIEYRSGFDLLLILSGEGGNYIEGQSRYRSEAIGQSDEVLRYFGHERETPLAEVFEDSQPHREA